MKSYGAMKATEFTKKQINVIFKMAKNGELKVQKFVINDMYNLADFYGYDDNKNAERSEAKIVKVLDNVFDGNFAKAQELIDDYTEWLFGNLSVKYQNNADRTLV